ncbi:WXG100 family type VII secretion target [Brevibacterium luteolum]|uniref:ESAT-6-like protein n=1 Tax=Brevibacterium luteolum TaxID=199591 RepID=A0A849ATW5_9MICO|nr:WXG100 family type VII secretion target [Brevibacterium luteolum]MBM7529544.1 WXG100 family type VII secretion target [Brevibacterium luteolum]NNG79551.1 WXG100 family type VII secretion target [Brevibacterium luteolum]
MAVIQVDAQEIEATVTRTRESCTVLHNEAASLMGHLRSLENSWRGGAAESFQQLAGEWEVVQRQVQESIESIRDALSAAGVQYSEVEEANRKRFSR